MRDPTGHYLDHAATSPLLPSARAAMVARLDALGNASSLHGPGRAARRVVEESREQFAEAVGARPSEIVFCSGGTEADNLAIKGLWWARQTPVRRRILISRVEHHAALDPTGWLAGEQGAELCWLDVDRLGRVDPDQVHELIEADPLAVAYVSVMLANNEVGTVQPVARIAVIAQAYEIPVHTDAVQALGQLPLDFADLGVDAMTLTGHKFGGPYGIGALVARRELDLTPLVHGGGQERDVRSGTLDVPAIAGLAAATETAVAAQPAEAIRLAGLRDELISGVLGATDAAVLTGDPADRLPGNAHFCFTGCEGDSLLLLLDTMQIYCSTGSACTAGVAEPSHVLSAMGYDDQLARGTLRFSLGHTSTREDVAAVVAAIGGVVARAQAAGIQNAGRPAAGTGAGSSQRNPIASIG